MENRDASLHRGAWSNRMNASTAMDVESSIHAGGGAHASEELLCCRLELGVVGLRGWDL